MVVGVLTLAGPMLVRSPWNNRLATLTFALATPLVGLYAERVLTRTRPAVRRAAAGLIAVTALAALVHTTYVVAVGLPRPLVGEYSVLRASRVETMTNVVYPSLGTAVEWAAREVRASGARTVGLWQGPEPRECLWWVLLRPGGEGPRLVDLGSVLPKHPSPPKDSVDLIISSDHTTAQCEAFAPPGWTTRTKGPITLIQPPTGR